MPSLKSELTLTAMVIFGKKFKVVETEAIAVSFTFALFDGLSAAFVDFLNRNLNIMRKIINFHEEDGCF